MNKKWSAFFEAFLNQCEKFLDVFCYVVCISFFSFFFFFLRDVGEGGYYLWWILTLAKYCIQ